MRLPFRLLPALVLALIAVSPSAPAATRYVTDQFQITLRAGESTGYKILKMLDSGEPLQVLGTNPGSEYSRVRTPQGTTGFVLTRQLQDEPVARERIVKVENRLRDLLEKPDAIAAQLARLQEEHQQVSADATRLRRENTELQQQLNELREASSNVVKLTDERDRLANQVTQLSDQRAHLVAENQRLRDRSSLSWFLIGAGVLGVGILLGFILPRLKVSPRRRSGNWNSL